MRNKERKTQIANQQIVEQGTENSNCQGTENLMENVTKNSPQGTRNVKLKPKNQPGTDNEMVKERKNR